MNKILIYKYMLGKVGNVGKYSEKNIDFVEPTNTMLETTSASRKKISPFKNLVMVAKTFENNLIG